MEIITCMIDKYTWVCSTCSQGLTRKSSADRHNNNLHSGSAMIVRPFEYIIGRLNGKFPPTTDPLLFRHKNKNDKSRQNGDNNSAYSHDNIPRPQNKIMMRNDYNSYGIPSSDSQPDLPHLVSSQEPFHNEGIEEKQSSYSNGHLRSLTKLEELHDLLNRHYSYQDAQQALALVYANLYNERNEDFLDTTLTQLRDIDRKKRSNDP
jgi:hypothetical protein